MPELPAGFVAGFVGAARDGSGNEAAEKSAELVSRREPARVVLGPGAGVSSHGADHDELRDPRSAPAGAAGRAGESVASASAKSSVVAGWAEEARAWDRFAGGTSIMAIERGLSSGW